MNAEVGQILSICNKVLIDFHKIVSAGDVDVADNIRDELRWQLWDVTNIDKLSPMTPQQGTVRKEAIYVVFRNVASCYGVQGAS